MQTIGERLEEARKRKGISIREAAENTKIRGDYLQKFEANTFAIDLPPLYIKGFLRAYSRFLDLDPERLVSDLNTLLAKEGKPARREHREVYGRVDFGDATRKPEGAEPAPTGERSAQDQAVMLKFAFWGAITLVIVVAVFFLIRVLFSSPAKPLPQTVTAPVSAPADATQTLTLTAIDNTRVKVVQDADDKVIFNGSLNRAETRTLPKVGRLRVTVEDRTKVHVEVNGRLYEIPPLQHGNYGYFFLD